MQSGSKDSFLPSVRFARDVVFSVVVLAALSACTAGAPSSRTEGVRASPPVNVAAPDDDMDQPLAKAPSAKFRSPFLEQQRKEAAERKAAEDASDPSRLPAQSINSPFRALAASNPLRVHALNVGAGMCVIVECPASTDVLAYDCGTLRQQPNDLTNEQARAYVMGVVKDAEPIIVMSHAHADHVNLITTVLDGVRARSIWIGGLESDYGVDISSNDPIKADLGAWIKGQVDIGVELHHGFKRGFNNSGEPVDALMCGDAETYILTVNNKPAVANDDNRRMHANSLLLLVKYGDFKAIVTGDAVGESEAAAIASYGALIGDATLLFASHHGAKTHGSNSDQWVEAVRPAIVIYSADTMPTYKHPTGVTVDKYRNVGSLKKTKAHPMWTDPTAMNSPKTTSKLAEYVTELNGAIVVESNGSTKVKVTCSLVPDCW